MGCDDYQGQFNNGGALPPGITELVNVDGCCDYIIPYRMLGLKPDADGNYRVLPFVDGDDE